jgi:hypothetical protein
MRNSIRTGEWFRSLRTGILAGLLGGLTEFGWVTLCADVTGEEPRAFALGATSAVGFRAFLPGFHAALLDVGINIAFVVVLSVVLTFAWRAISRRRDLTNPFPFMLAALTALWLTNFFVVLPIVRPGFIHLVPYSVSLASALLLGVAIAAVVREELPRRMATAH